MRTTIPRARWGARELQLVALAAMLLLLSEQLPAGESDTAVTVDSSWERILAAAARQPRLNFEPAIRTDLPYVGFGPTFVSLANTCRDGGVLRAAALGRPSAEVPVASLPLSVTRGTGVVNEPGYTVGVSRVMERAFSADRVALFQRVWRVPACPPS